jgi:Methylene-tetrahydrofolate reductase C terminal
MYSVRRWSVRHAGGLETFYGAFERVFVALDPVWKWLGYDRVEKPVAGQCALSSTGMSCSMNCPKNLRNGPCGGVRANGNCEVKPDMRCVWVEAFEGSERMREGKQAIRVVQIAVDRRLQGKSSWLKVARDKSQSQALEKA